MFDEFIGKVRNNEHILRDKLDVYTKEEKSEAASYLLDYYLRKISFSGLPQYVRGEARVALANYITALRDGKTIDGETPQS